jgi:hypothetical protein
MDGSEYFTSERLLAIVEPMNKTKEQTLPTVQDLE